MRRAERSEAACLVSRISANNRRGAGPATVARGGVVGYAAKRARTLKSAPVHLGDILARSRVFPGDVADLNIIRLLFRARERFVESRAVAADQH